MSAQFSVLTTVKLPHFSVLADRCSSMNQIKQIHAQMIISARIQDNYAASRIISFCALSETGDLNYAIKLFNNTTEPNSFMWNTLIRALAGSPNPSQSLSLYAKMRKFGVFPGKHTFPFVLKGCANCGGSLLVGRQIHAHVVKFGLDEDVYVVNGLMRCYGVSGCASDARRLFDEMPERNLIVWTTMISGYAQNFCSDEALVLFDEMLVEGVEPNGATLSSVLSACARSGCLELGEQIHGFIEEKGIEMGLILGTALVDMYAKNGAITMARNVFDEMPERNIATWNAMVCGLAAHGHAEGALELFREMEREKVSPNNVTFVGVLSACCHAGLVEVGLDVFNSMKREYGIEPKIEHYGCMVDMLGRSGRLVEAEELVYGMIWKADVVVLGALLGSCKHHGNFEVAERVVDRMLELDPQNHGVHVFLSNMYAEAGRWEDVLRLRKVMKDGGLKKVPGWSLVDGNS
ncbi:hypothetical protein Syun_024486 [Stephania yunnanensis]|uniref:Pentatricopeptide repeat-containing protein n=1 Tax=Stephania yunnanensis TaxID=152371 RepID=A0AAP0NJ73_9MAGN